MRTLTLMALAASLALAGNVSVTLQTGPEYYNLSRSDDYTVVDFVGVPAGTAPSYTGVPGEPQLPVISGNVVIPAGADVEKITVTPLERSELGVFRLHPAQPMRPLSQMNSVPFVGPSQQVYGSDAVYPAEALRTVPAGSKAGFRIAGFLYCPFEYRPQSGRLTLVTRARVDVSYRENAVSAPVLTPSQLENASAEVSELVMNKSDVARMAPAAAEKDAAEVDVVIFTNGTMAPSMQPLCDWLARKGYHTVVIRHDTLTNSGTDVQEKMRNVLKRMFAENGLKYVILGGDDGTCPIRYGYLPYSTYTVPADMYFGDLDGSWNGNHNSYWGEMSGDSVDLFHDIYVGRLPFDNATHLATILQKDTTFELHPDSASLHKFIGAGEWLWQNIDISGMICNRIIIRALNEMCPWQVDSGLSMTPSQMITGMNAGRQFFHFAGHGSYTAFGSTFSTSNLASLTNAAKPVITNSIACDCGWFDSRECLGELFLTTTNGGAAASMLNARYGWGAPPTLGPNDNLDCQFYNNYIKGLTVGQSHGLARDFLRNEAFSQMTMRWAMYTNTLQGDPTMRMWRTRPRDLVVDFPDSVAAAPQTLTADVSYAGGGAAAGARVALTHMGALITRAVTNSAGLAALAIPAIGDTWTMALTVTAQDGRQFTKPVAANEGYENALVVHSRSLVDDPNGRLDPYEQSDVYLIVENRGNASATAVSGTLTSNSPYVTIVDGTSSYGDVAVGDTARGDAYEVSVSRDCPHGHRAELTLVTTSTDGLWRSDLELVVGLPHARGGHWATIDTGDYCLTVCANGGIGTTRYRGEGYGLIYPKARMWSAADLMHGGLMLGTDTTWVADNFYGVPWQASPEDFQMEESLRIVYPPQLGHQQYTCVFSDARHPQPKGLRIVHTAYASALNFHKDFAVLEYRIINTDTAAITGLYAGIGCDFRTGPWNVLDQYDYAGTDSARKLAYIKSHSSGETLAVGIRHIYPGAMNGWANSISHTTYINDGFTKVEKMKFMDGRLRQTTGPTAGNWHALSSSGPYAIPAGDTQVVAFVMCGGRTVATMTANSDTAVEWYDPPTAVEEPAPATGLVRRLEVRPAVFTDRVSVSYGLGRVAPVTVTVADASGRVVERFELPAAQNGTFLWRPAVTGGGVYFLRVGDVSTKVVRAE